MRIVLTSRGDSLRTIAARYYDNRSIEGVVKMLMHANQHVKNEYKPLDRNTSLNLPDYVQEYPLRVK